MGSGLSSWQITTEPPATNWLGWALLIALALAVLVAHCAPSTTPPDPDQAESKRA